VTEPLVVEELLGSGLPTLRIGNGPRPLAMLPGLSTTPGLPTGRERALAISGWEPLLDRYTIYRIGRRVRPVGVSFDEMAGDVSTGLEALGPPVDLIGASTGGAIALLVAAARPDLVRKLVLVITGPRLSAYGRRKRDITIRAIEAGRWRRAFGEMFTIGATSSIKEAAFFAFGWLLGPRLVGVGDDPTLLLAELEAWGRYDADELASSVACPTLVIGTERDRLFPPASARQLAERIPSAKLVIVPGRAHMWPPDATAELISPFLG
jgi:pimeloyl-ACP methyl ester carboxylesterase